MNGKIIKTEGRILEIHGQKFEFRLDMNAICELEDIYPGNALHDMAAQRVKAARAVLYAGMKASLPEGTTLEEFGAMLGLREIALLSAQVKDVITRHLDIDVEADDTPGGE